eukprot:SAG31_NODE_22632_length_521_cov_1.097156_1_plen_65_part_01
MSSPEPAGSEGVSAVGQIDFVWQNAPTVALRAARESAAVYSHLANAEILEDKVCCCSGPKSRIPQ